ncbi:AEC family transporter [Chakrabartyella piscis]|uniref:AEC family transporter n=1 Tax=Chakrabartyella piscis TaxID=2918914 RepID=UPI002958B00D|nr:AEC family transporter [Chakrabartyella piscis]
MALVVFMQLVTMFILLLMGVVLFKKGMISEVQSKGLSIFLTKIAVPCNIIVLMQREYSYDISIAFIKTAGVTFLICSVASLLFFLVGKCMGMDMRSLGLFSGAGAYSNVIFMGQPLILAMYGADGLIYCVSIMFTCNVYLFLVCSSLFAFGGEYKKPAKLMLKDAFINLVCFSSVIGFGFFMLSIELPTPIYDALNYAAITTVAISMVYIGSLLAMANIKEVFKDKQVYVFSFLTLLIVPIITKFVASFFLDGLALNVIVVLMGTPAAAATPSFADVYGNDAKRASEFVFVSTLLSMATLPLVAQFLCT